MTADANDAPSADIRAESIGLRRHVRYRTVRALRTAYLKSHKDDEARASKPDIG